MRGEGGYRDAGWRRAYEFGQGLCNLGFGRRTAVADGVRRIADQREHAFVAERLQFRGVRWPANQRSRIDFPIAGMDYAAKRRADGKRVRLWNGMRHVDEIDGERA